MQITDVRIRRVEKEGKMKAVVSITIENEFVIQTSHLTLLPMRKEVVIATFTG